MKFRLALLVSVFAIFLFTNEAFCTHVRSGQIRVQQISAGNLTCKITIEVWTNSNTTVLVGGELSYLNFGDGTQLLVPKINNIIIDEAREVAYAEYTIYHTFASPGKYVVSFQEPNRNAGILNMMNSVNTLFYLETSFLLDPQSTKAYITPEFLAPPIFIGSPSLGYSFSLAARDVNDYMLFYQLSVPQMDRHLPVYGYVTPDNLAVNSFNGLITWDGEFQGLAAIGELAIAVKIYQIHEDLVVGYVLRDIQIISEESLIEGAIADDQDSDPNGRVFVGENQTKEIQILAESTGNEITLEAFSSLGSDNYSFEAVEGQDHASGTIKLFSTSGIVRDNPYMITVRATVKSTTEKLTRDINYLFYTKDIEPTEPVIVLANEQSINPRNIYPNPVRDFLKVDLPNTRNFTVAILNQQGVRVQQHSISMDNSVDLRALPSGFYICEVREGNKLTMQKKIIKE